MAGFTDPYELTVLDATFADTNGLALSINGTSELAVANGYERDVITWAAAASGAKASSAELTFTASGGDWGTVSHFAVYTISAAGTQMTDWTALDAEQVVNDGGTLTVAIGDLEVTLD